MFKDYKVAALIPARAGSKGVPGKNIKQLKGKPLILYSVETALTSGIFDHVCISTDISQINEILGSKPVTTIIRPAALATDCAMGVDVIKHGISVIEKTYGFHDFYFYLQPTSPLRNVDDITRSIELAIKKDADYVLSVCECEHSPLLVNTLPEDQSLGQFLNREVSNKNRQELSTFYRINGAIYLIRNRADNITTLDFYGKNSFAYVMPQERSIDIDSEIDFKVAEVLLNDREI